MKTETKRNAISMTLPKQLLKLLDEHAKKEFRSRSSMITVILEKYFKDLYITLKKKC